MMGWQWHQLDHMQIICTSLQTDSFASTSPLSFHRPDALPVAVAQPTASKHWRESMRNGISAAEKRYCVCYTVSRSLSVSKTCKTCSRCCHWVLALCLRVDYLPMFQQLYMLCELWNNITETTSETLLLANSIDAG